MRPYTPVYNEMDLGGYEVSYQALTERKADRKGMRHDT
jgi:hypothetical protein